MLTGARHVSQPVPFRPCHLHATAPRNFVQVICLACLACGLGTGHRKYGQGCFDTSACPISEDSWRTRVGENKRPKSGIVSDQVILQHAGAKGRVFTFVALAMPDHARRLFTLMCFQCALSFARFELLGRRLAQAALGCFLLGSHRVAPQVSNGCPACSMATFSLLLERVGRPLVIFSSPCSIQHRLLGAGFAC